MKTRIIEAHDASNFNWGKFLVGRFDSEWPVGSIIGGGKSLLNSRGWTPRHLLVLDLETGEGFLAAPGGMASADLNKHAIWVCPMYEYFLEWLYTQDLTDLDALPAVVNLGKVPVAMQGYRRSGPSNRK